MNTIYAERTDGSSDSTGCHRWDAHTQDWIPLHCRTIRESTANPYDTNPVERARAATQLQDRKWLEQLRRLAENARGNGKWRDENTDVNAHMDYFAAVHDPATILRLLDLLEAQR